MRIWFKMMKDNHLLRDTTITDESDDTRTHKIFRAIDEVCYAFDLGKPIWLDANVAEFKRHAKTRFTQDSFIESIDLNNVKPKRTGQWFRPCKKIRREPSGDRAGYCSFACYQ